MRRWATILFKTDKQLKTAAANVAQEMGIPLSAYLNQQLRELVLTRQANFQAPLRPNKKTAAYLRRVIADADAGRNMSPAFDNIKDATAWLEADED